MLLSALAFLAGTCLLLLFPWLPDPVWLVAIIIATVPMFRFRLLRCVVVSVFAGLARFIRQHGEGYDGDNQQQRDSM